MDNCRNTDHSLGAGVGEQLHHGRFYTLTVGYSHYHCAAPSHFGAEAHLVIWFIPS